MVFAYSTGVNQEARWMRRLWQSTATWDSEHSYIQTEAVHEHQGLTWPNPESQSRSISTYHQDTPAELL